MRKIVSLVSVCLVCLTLCLCVPVEGRAMSFTDEPLRYSVLQFDYIETPTYKIPCPFNSTSDSTYREPFVFGDLGIGGTVSMAPSGEYIDGYLNAIFGDEVTFYSALQLIRMQALVADWSYYVSCGTAGMYFTGADVSCTVITLNDDWANSNYVGAAHQTISGSISPTATGSILLGRGLYDILAAYGCSDNSYVLLSDLKITFHYTIDSVETASIWIASHFTSFDPDLLLGQWVWDQGIVVPDSSTGSSDFNLGTWLADCVTGFVRMEIFPGFSIDKLFYAVLVIGILLWFLNLFG